MAQNIIFMGTPEFSVPILKSLHESKHNILEVYTQPPKKKNRGQVINLTPVHEFSNENSINVRCPEELNTKDEFDYFKEFISELLKGLLQEDPKNRLSANEVLEIIQLALPFTRKIQCFWRGVHKKCFPGWHFCFKR